MSLDSNEKMSINYTKLDIEIISWMSHSKNDTMTASNLRH